ncbi:hypothetical protein SAMN04489864_101420 [Pedobacter insulae]|uniref:YhhN-like protein n=1 Tax=Pedobacter insulae TaxID=414048 RepID=A0A1I2TLY4_9SPHI|nr:hypothetical protein SAMN04489864_101420 [Pedobacter insulae]
MNDLQVLLAETLIWVQLFTALIALFYWTKLRNSYWRWFIAYLCIVFLVEALSKWGLKSYPNFKVYLYDFFGIPIQFLFFYWLYAVKSLKSNRLFWICVLIYCISFLPYFTLFAKQNIVYSLSYTVGNVVLMLLVFLEILKQIKSEKILLFRENFMFYINIGIMVFYIGTLPFFSFYGLILKNLSLWTNYYIFFMVANHIMYLLFISAFLWGKPNTH